MVKLIVTGACAALLSLGCLAQTDTAEQELEQLQGEWAIDAVVSNGRVRTLEELEGGKIVFEGDRMTVVSEAGGRHWSRTYQVRLRPELSPKGIDGTDLDGPFEGLTTPGIYQLEDGVLRYAVSNLPGSTERPADFRAEWGSRATRFTLKRVVR